jgi:3-phenylpropionate/cinnamic acid dioxygenase small subunit
MYPYLEGLHDWIMASPDRNWGFITYRCTYGDDEKWDKFMDFLKARVKFCLEDDGAVDMYDRLDWIVIENKETLDGADPKQVKK